MTANLAPAILALDAGTTEFKLGVFTPGLQVVAQAARRYTHPPQPGIRTEIEAEAWWQALRLCCRELDPALLKQIRVVSLSVTTPGFVLMDETGRALRPAILFSDGRAHRQARWIRRQVGERRFLEEACNLPVSGGSSLASLLWVRQNEPEAWRAAARFGHCNTYLARRLCGAWTIDPSTTSITGLVHTARGGLEWNREVLAAAGIPERLLPELRPSYHPAGQILPEVARELGLPPDCCVLVGGNDAVLACLSAGAVNPGDICNIHGTCEITTVCVDRPFGSPGFNLRCHVLPGRWMTFYVLNAGGSALEWFHSVFCQDMSREAFFTDYLPGVLARFLADPDPAWEARLPECVPYLQGSRYATRQLTARFSGLTLGATRDDFLLALVRANARLSGEHLAQVARQVALDRRVRVTGGGARLPGMLAAKRRWMGPFDFEFQDQSSLLGAAMLGQYYLAGKPEQP